MKLVPGVKLDIAHPRDGLMVEADIGLIERVLTNLIDNALRSTPRGGTVRLDAIREGAAVAVSVSAGRILADSAVAGTGGLLIYLVCGIGVLGGRVRGRSGRRCGCEREAEFDPGASRR